MTLSNRSMPASTVIPVLAYPAVREAADWLCDTFGFTERLRIGDHRAQLAFGTGAIVVVGLSGETGPQCSHSIMVRVADVDSHHRRVQEAGAVVLSPPADYPYGERQYSAQDIGGHCWTFSQTIADVDPQSWGGVLFE